MTELAKLLIDDGQPIRVIEGYLNETFLDIKGKKVVSNLEFNGVDTKLSSDPNHIASCAINIPTEISALEFIEYVIDSANMTKRWILENKTQSDN